VYVSNEGSNTISVISGTTVVDIISVGTNPVDVTFDSANGNVYVSDEGSNIVSVIPTIQSTTSPSSGTVGSTVTIFGNSLAPSSTIDIKYDGTTLAIAPAVTSSPTGSFSATFTVPPSSASSHTLSSIDTSGN